MLWILFCEICVCVVEFELVFVLFLFYLFFLCVVCVCYVYECWNDVCWGEFFIDEVFVCVFYCVCVWWFEVMFLGILMLFLSV